MHADREKALRSLFSHGLHTTIRQLATCEQSEGKTGMHQEIPQDKARRSYSRQLTGRKHMRVRRACECGREHPAHTSELE